MVGATVGGDPDGGAPTRLPVRRGICRPASGPGERRSCWRQLACRPRPHLPAQPAPGASRRRRTPRLRCARNTSGHVNDRRQVGIAALEELDLTCCDLSRYSRRQAIADTRPRLARPATGLVAAPVAWSPVIPVEPVAIEPGGDSHCRYARWLTISAYANRVRIPSPAR